MPGQQAPMLTFREATRERLIPVPITSGATVAAGGGGQFTAQLPKVGFLSDLYIRYQPTVNCGVGGGTILYRGPWDALTRLRLDVNVGAANIYDTTGYGNFLVQTARRRAFNPAAADIYSVPVLAGDNAWDLRYHIPVAANYGPNFHVGLVNLQNPELVCTLTGNYGLNADFVTPGGAGTGITTGTLAVWARVFDIPDPRVAMLPPSVLHRIVETQQPLTNIGDNTYLVPREGILLRLLMDYEIAGAKTALWDHIRCQINRVDTIYQIDNWIARYDAQQRWSTTFPTSCFAWEGWGAGVLEPARGDNRDVLDTEQATTLEWITSMGAAPGAGINRINHIREIVQGVRNTN